MRKVNRSLYLKAQETDGFFDVMEADFLIRTIHMMPGSAHMLEIGSYKGRSTLFALSALTKAQTWIVVDAFRTAAAYSEHSFWDLHRHLDDPRAIILPMTLANAYPHLDRIGMDLVFIDGDHSFLGISQDLALGISLCKDGALLLCHDYCDLFPGVVASLDNLVRLKILEPVESVKTLACFRVVLKPAWLTDPSVYREFTDDKTA
jgi:predicted O-methyltransferase YrrM